jgi:hypothetical protein
MKKLHTSLILLLVSISIVFSSCKDGDNPYPAVKPTTEQDLIYKYEHGHASQKYFKGSYFIGGLSAFPDCINDNEFTLQPGGVFTEPEGSTKCDPSAPGIADSGTWSIKHFKADSTYSNKDTLLLSSGTLGDVRASLDRLTKDSLVSTFILSPAVLALYGLPAGTKIVFKAKSF